MSPRFLAFAVLGALVVAGCIQPSDASDPSSPPPSTATEGGNMTAKEQRTDGTCSGSGDKPYCAQRRVSVSGGLAGIPKMDVDLRTVNGGVTIKQGAAGSWGLVATLKAYGGSPEEAKANLERIAYHWRHTDGSSHFVQAEADFSALNNCQCSPQAQLDATLPPGLVMVVTAETVNGGVTVSGATDGLSASSTNGKIQVTADVTQVSLSTTNGKIDAKLKPTASGRIRASTTNGEVVLTLPEDAQHGYDVTGRTTNGEVEIALKDGDLGPCPEGSQYYTPPCNERSFKTKSYDARAIRSEVTASGTNGEIEINPA